jgi:biopolymer transport protein ExbD
MRPTRNLAPLKDTSMQMTSFIDIVFLLVIFFMIVTDMSQLDAEQMTLPIAYQAVDDKDAPVTRITVNVNKFGKFRIKGEEYSRERLEGFLQDAAIKLGPDKDGFMQQAVKIRADADVAYKYVQGVMLACMKAKIWKISFGVSPKDNTMTGKATVE